MTPEQLSRVEALLNERERDALRRLGSAASNRLSPATAAQFFSLFLQGYTCEDIAKQNANFGGLALGLIVKARVEYDWDAERDKHVQTLMIGARQALEKTTLEAIQFASDGMAVYHKMVGDKFRRYLQTGDNSVLGEFKDMSFKTYKDMVTTLRRVTGKEDMPGSEPRAPLPPPLAPQVTVVNVLPEPEPQVPTLVADSPVSAQDAAAVLAFLTGGKEPASG